MTVILNKNKLCDALGHSPTYRHTVLQLENETRIIKSSVTNYDLGVVRRLLGQQTRDCQHWRGARTTVIYSS